MVRVILVALVAAIAGCRADPGTADYGSFPVITNGEDDPFLEGPNPFTPGTPRLTIGGYEGQATESILVDNVNRFFFLFDTVGDGSGQFTVFADTSSDRIEGLESIIFEHQGTGFWGAGWFWYVAEDISAYSTLYISAKSNDAGFEDFQLRMQSGDDRPVDPSQDDVTEASVSASTYGYVADGEWHNLEVPLSDFASQGLDLTSIRSPLFFLGGEGDSGEALRIDNVFFE